MRTICHLLSILLLLTSIASAASAQADISITAELDQRILDAVDTDGISDRALMLALAESRAMSESDTSADLRDAINRQRTDLQLSATSDSPHATSILEKPGIADLLSIALDRGAITKVANGTGLTLSTTPYAFSTGFGATDTPQRWVEAGWQRNLSLSATFSSTDVTASDFSSFTSGEVKYVITGNRSPRDPELLRSVRKDLGAAFLVADTALTRDCGGLLSSQPLLDAQGEMNVWLRSHTDATAAEVRAHLFEVVEDLAVNQDLLRICVDTILKGEKTIKASLNQVAKATKRYLDDKRNQFSVAALFVRDGTLSDYYSAKLLYGHDFAPLTVNLNGETSWNRDSRSPAGTEIRELRSYSVELGLNSNTFANGRLDGSLSAKASRDDEEDSKDLVISEAKLNVHLTDRWRLPVTLSYANRETETVKYGWQVNVGLNALLDEVLRQLK
jgi:hypothetical protein